MPPFVQFSDMESLILENDRVLLRPLKKEDYSHLEKFSLEEPELWTYSLVSAAGKDNLKAYLDLALSSETSLPFIVYDKKYKEYAGSTRLYDLQLNHETTQLGYTWYGKKYQGTGLNKNAKYLLLKYAFESLNLKRVEFRADATNQRSIAAMLSLGCVKEGILRSNCKSLTGRRDSIILSILAEEWSSKVKTSLEGYIK